MAIKDNFFCYVVITSIVVLEKICGPHPREDNFLKSGFSAIIRDHGTWIFNLTIFLEFEFETINN